MNDLLTVSGMDAGYGRVRVLHSIDLAVPKGQIVALLGANGAGKTTTLRAITSQIAKTGTVTLDGADISGLRTHRIARAGVATVPDDRGTIGDLTVGENLLVGAAARSGRTSVGQRRDYVLGLFPVLGEMITRPANLLSGGQQQMLAISRALMSHPRLLVLDEPSQGLAPIVVQDIFATIRDLATTDGLSVLVAEQNAVASLAIADRALVLSNGSVQASGPAAGIKDSDELASAYLGPPIGGAS